MTLIDAKIAQAQVIKLKELAEDAALNTNRKYEDSYQELRRQFLGGKLDIFDFEQECETE